MKIMTVVGARPNFMKAAPIIAAIGEHNRKISRNSVAVGDRSRSTAIYHVLVHTGQHYDQRMSDSFFADLNLPNPDFHLGVGSLSHAAQTAEIMRKFEDILLHEEPDALVVVGDVNSTVACALVAAKVSFGACGVRPLIAHVEAGLRSFDRAMPEEINRIVTDQLSDLLFVTEESGLRNLALEGVTANKVHFVGNTMIDSLLAYKEKAEASTILDDLGLRVDAASSGFTNSTAAYALLTLHRPGNVDSRDTLFNILEGLAELTLECPVIFPVHPRTQNRINEFGLKGYFDSHNNPHESGVQGAQVRPTGIRMIEPLRYLDFLCLMKNAALVITDSGGIQEETTCLGIPCVTVRENTERPATTESGTNVIAGTTKEKIRVAIRQQKNRKNGNSIPKKWDGRAAPRIVDILISACYERTVPQQSVASPSCA